MLREVVNFRLIPEHETFYINPGYDLLGPVSAEEKNLLLKDLERRDKNMYTKSKFTPPKNRIPIGLEKYRLLVTAPKENNDWKGLHVLKWINNTYEKTYFEFKLIFVFDIAKYNDSNVNPVRLDKDPDIPSKIYWFYKGKLYWENDSLDAESVKALADARESKKQRKIEFVKGPSKAKGKTSARFISDDVKVAVWRRDEARCVKCGSNENLEFDHIIPVALGGSSTERNVQLLCERCNREKGADLK